MYRLYVDEVGTDSLTHLDKDKHRYLSLSGAVMRTEYVRDKFAKNLDWIKSKIFDHDPDSPLVFHRKEILGFKGPYECLRNVDKRELFNTAILRLFEVSEYTIITAFIDKAWLLKQEHWERNHPYHFLMEILVEKYVQFLIRQKTIGDIMPESREGKDHLLQAAFERVCSRGTHFVEADKIASMIRARNLKFRRKKDNIAGLQLCDLLAHPSHIHVRTLMKHEVNLGAFSTKIVGILTTSKYDRSPWSNKIIGYGIKHLPQ